MILEFLPVKDSKIGETDEKVTSLTSELEAANQKATDIETQLNSQITDLNGAISANQEEINNLKSENEDLTTKLTTSQNEITQINSQLTELNNTLLQRDTQIQELSDKMTAKEQEIETATAQLSEAESELEELKPPEIGSGGFTVDERITCPMCGSVGHNIKTVEDKSKVLSYVGHIPMYAKKNVCKKCGYEF